MYLMVCCDNPFLNNKMSVPLPANGHSKPNAQFTTPSGQQVAIQVAEAALAVAPPSPRGSPSSSSSSSSSSLGMKNRVLGVNRDTMSPGAPTLRATSAAVCPAAFRVVSLGGHAFKGKKK